MSCLFCLVFLSFLTDELLFLSYVIRLEIEAFWNQTKNLYYAHVCWETRGEKGPWDRNRRGNLFTNTNWFVCHAEQRDKLTLWSSASVAFFFHLICQFSIQGHTMRPRRPLAVTDDVMSMTHGLGFVWSELLVHALFARCADLESLTEGPMMFPGRAEQLLHGGRDGAGREQQPAGLLAARGTKPHFFFKAVLAWATPLT